MHHTDTEFNEIIFNWQTLYDCSLSVFPIVIHENKLLPSSDGRIQCPGDVCGSQHQDPFIVITNTYNEFVLDNVIRD